MLATIFPFQFRMLPLYSVSAPVQMTSPTFDSVSPGTGFAPVTSPDGASSSSMVCPSREEKKEPESVPSKNTRFFTVLYPWMRRTKRGSSRKKNGNVIESIISRYSTIGSTRTLRTVRLMWQRRYGGAWEEEEVCCWEGEGGGECINGGQSVGRRRVCVCGGDR